MELPAIGRVEDPAELDLDPIVVPLVGYTLDREEVEEKFSFRPMQPAGAALDILRHTDATGAVPLGPVMRFLDKCLMPDDSERFQAFLDRDDVMIQQTALVDLYKAITEAYAARPTTPSSGSAGGGSSTRQTSAAAARAKASRSRPKR